MVKGYFDIIYIAINESEAYTPLVVDRYCMLSASVVLQRVKAVTRWCFKIVNARCQVNIFESAYSSSEKIRLKYSRFPRFKKILCVFIRKGFNHVCIVTSHVTIVKLNFASRIHCDWRGISRQYSFVIPEFFHLRHARALPPLSSPSSFIGDLVLHHFRLPLVQQNVGYVRRFAVTHPRCPLLIHPRFSSFVAPATGMAVNKVSVHISLHIVKISLHPCQLSTTRIVKCAVIYHVYILRIVRFSLHTLSGFHDRQERFLVVSDLVLFSE